MYVYSIDGVTVAALADCGGLRPLDSARPWTLDSKPDCQPPTLRASLNALPCADYGELGPLDRRFKRGAMRTARLATRPSPSRSGPESLKLANPSTLNPEPREPLHPEPRTLNPETGASLAPIFDTQKPKSPIRNPYPWPSLI